MLNLIFILATLNLALISVIATKDVSVDVQPLELTHLFSGGKFSYFVSSSPADIVEGEQLCQSSGYKLLSIEDEAKFQEILPHLQAFIGVDGVWTSGIETNFADSTKELLWSSTALPLDYLNFAPTLNHILTGTHRRTRRGIHGGNGKPSCNCNGSKQECPYRPSCSHINCTITGETCEVEQPVCTEPSDQDCYIVEPKPVCTVTCPPCTITRGQCRLIQPVCTVAPGTPNCHTTRKGHCAVIPANYKVIPGKCKPIQEPCAVLQPEKPCTKPFNCSCQLNSKFGSCMNDAPAPLVEQGIYNCTMNCQPGEVCPNPCPKEDNKCYNIFDCAPTLVCQAPPVICPPPIHHCLPAELVLIREEKLDCDEPETTCDPPILECTKVQRVCEEDIITCPAPETICTPAVSHCPRPEYTCSKPIVDCQDPTVECPELPQCQIPPPCYKPPQKPCNCREKRDVYSKGALVSAKCIALKKRLSFKWAVEECQIQNYVICESSLPNEQKHFA